MQFERSFSKSVNVRVNCSLLTWILRIIHDDRIEIRRYSIKYLEKSTILYLTIFKHEEPLFYVHWNSPIFIPTACKFSNFRLNSLDLELTPEYPPD